MGKSRHYYVRRAHRYLGVVLGIQFLCWTIGGLYFSWTNIDEIHGDFQRKTAPRLTGALHMVSPDSVFARNKIAPDSIESVQLVSILQRPYWSIAYYANQALNRALADAQTGVIRQPVAKAEAIRIARAGFAGNPKLKAVKYLASADGHHEYREKPLPAWAVTFDHPTNTTVYVSANFGKVESFRNDKWRVFDFLWMLHTMDYKNRDDINNWLLRAFSVLGLLTIFSGFALFIISNKRRRKSKQNSKRLTML